MNFSKPNNILLTTILFTTDSEIQTDITTDSIQNGTHRDLRNGGIPHELTDEQQINTELDRAHLDVESTIFIETVSNHAKAIYACVCIISLIFSSISLTVLRRTKKIPHAAKFLSTGLLCFDSLYISSITVRKFIQDPLYNTSINVLSTTVLQLAYVTVALMSLERYLMFYKPMIYMKKCTKSLLHSVAFTLWILTATIFQTVRYGICYWKFKSMLVFVQAGKCNQIVTIHYSTLVILVLSISMICYWGIFKIIRTQLANSEKRKVSFASTATLLRSYKSTSLVLIYLLVIFVTSVTYAIIILHIRFMNLDVAQIRITLELISTVNCILDPFLYVMWFKESQMELFKLLSRFSKRCEEKAEGMKYRIFDIVTANTTPIHSTIDGL